MSFKLVVVYFLLGGITVSAITYFGSQGRSQVAAFVAFLPSTSLITLCTIYLNSSTQAAVSYAKSMLILLPPWVLYVLAVIWLLPKVGLPLTIAISLAVYLIFALITMKLVS